MWIDHTIVPVNMLSHVHLDIGGLRRLLRRGCAIAILTLATRLQTTNGYTSARLLAPAALVSSTAVNRYE